MSAKAIVVDDRPISDPAGADAADRRIAVAAHEIRTPLGGILALADLLLAEDLSAGARGHANALKAAAEHLFGLSSSLLGGARPPAPKPLDVDDFLGRVAPPLAARAAAKGLAFRVARAPGTPDRVLADEAALRQIVDNLADNALRATEEGSVELLVERVSGDAESVTLRIALRDTGPGVGPEPERLFAPFAQGGQAPGAAGLGLAVVAEIARRMGGDAMAADRPNGGAEVSATLRLGALDRRAANGPIRVLVAEDNAINQRVVGTLLEHFGHGFDMVENGAAAVAAVGGGDYDLVLMDAVMPTLDGLAATRAIRAMEGPAGAIRIVGLTAHAFDEDIAAFLAAGADAVVTKPISVAELWRAIDIGERAAG